MVNIPMCEWKDNLAFDAAPGGKSWTLVWTQGPALLASPLFAAAPVTGVPSFEIG